MRVELGGANPLSAPPCYVLRSNKMSIGEDVGITASQRSSKNVLCYLLIACHVPITTLGTVVTKPLRHSPTNKEPRKREAHIKKKIRKPNTQHGIWATCCTKLLRRSTGTVSTLWNSRRGTHMVCSARALRTMLVLPRLCLVKFSKYPLPLYLQSKATTLILCLCAFQMVSHYKASNHRACCKVKPTSDVKVTVPDMRSSALQGFSVETMCLKKDQVRFLMA